MAISVKEAEKYFNDNQKRKEEKETREYEEYVKRRKRLQKKTVSYIEKMLDEEIKKGNISRGRVAVELKPLKEEMTISDLERIEKSLLKMYSLHGWKDVRVRKQGKESSKLGGYDPYPAKAVLTTYKNR